MSKHLNEAAAALAWSEDELRGVINLLDRAKAEGTCERVPRAICSMEVWMQRAADRLMEARPDKRAMSMWEKWRRLETRLERAEQEFRRSCVIKHRGI